MAKRAFPNLGLTGGYAPGDDGWGDEQNANLLMLSTIVQGGVIGRVAAVPGAPAQGDVYVLTADPNKNAVAAYDNGAWVYFAPKEGWLFYDRGTNNYVSFDGAAWQDLVTSGGGGGGGLEDAPSDGKLYARQDGAWVEVTSGGGGGGTAGGLKFRYARFLNITNYSDGASAREIQFKNNGVQLAAPAVVSQNASSEYPFQRAFDGDLTNFFSTYGVGVNFVGVIDFGAVVEVDELVWLSRTDSYQQAPSKVEFQYSMDGKVYQSVTVLYDLAGWTQGGAARSVSFEGLGQSSGGGSGAAVPHRYWRIAMPPGIGDYYGYSVAELQFRKTKGGAQAAVGGTPFGSAANEGSIENVYDSDDTTYWANNFGSGNQYARSEYYLGYDFGAPVDIQEIMLRSRKDAGVVGSTQVPWSGRVEFSDDGIHFTTAWLYSFPKPTAVGETHALSRPPSSGGGGGSSASGPTIVQTAAFRKGGALTLPNAPKDGNYIVLVWTGFPNNQQQPPGFAKVDQVQSNGNNGVAIYVRRYVADDPTVWNVGSTSDSGWAVYEISKLKNITRNSSTVGSLGLSGNAFTVPIPLVGDGLYVFAFEQDNAPNFVLDAKAGLVVDATLTAANGENHSGLVGHLTPDWVSPAITGTLDQPLAPVFAAWNLT